MTYLREALTVACTVLALSPYAKAGIFKKYTPLKRVTDVAWVASASKGSTRVIEYKGKKHTLTILNLAKKRGVRKGNALEILVEDSATGKTRRFVDHDFDGLGKKDCAEGLEQDEDPNQAYSNAITDVNAALTARKAEVRRIIDEGAIKAAMSRVNLTDEDIRRLRQSSEGRKGIQKVFNP